MSAYGPRFRSLASMNQAGIPWSRAVESAGAGDVAWESAARAIDRGRTFGEAFADIVDPLDAALLAAGEQDGSLEHVLVEIADAQEEAKHRRRQALTAILYPLVLAHIGALLLPVPNWLQGDWAGGLSWMALILVPTWGYLLFQRWTVKRDRIVPRHGEPPAPPPLVGPWRNRVEEADARAFHALGRLYEAGLPLPQAIDLAIQAGWGGRAAVDLAQARRRVARGEDLAGAWRGIPSEAAGQLRSAEEAGSLGAALRRVADELRFGVQMRRKRYQAVLPVVVMLVIGGIVGVRVLSFYAQLYSNLPY